MFAYERQKKITDMVNESGAVWVARLAAMFGVTEETIRRDLEKLEKQELLRRTHGGAVSVEETTYEFSLERRKNINVEVKMKLAHAAVNYIASGDTIFLDASTTTFFMAKELKSFKNITVITNSLRVINELSVVENVKVIGVGGIVSANQSFVGTLAEQTLSGNYFASKSFFSGKGVLADVGILESNESECGIKQRMIKNSSKKYCICDKSKLGRIGYSKLAEFSEIDYFITDAVLESELKLKFEENNIEIINL